MASLINSIRNITGDPWWVVKVAVISSIVFLVLDQAYYNQDNPTFIVAYVLLGIFLMGCSSTLMFRNINNISPLLPSLYSIPELIAKSVVASLAVSPGVSILYLSLNFVKNNYELEPFVAFVIYLCIILFFAPFIFIPAVLCSVRGSLGDSFKFRIIYQSAGNYTVQFASYLIQYVLIVGTVTFLLYTMLLEMLGDSVSLLILKCVVITISILSVFSYSSDLYQDIIPKIEIKKKKRNLHY